MARNQAARLSALTAIAALLSLRAGFCLAATAPTPAENVDLELVLTVDVSGSIDYQESELQRRGTAEAFQSKEVVQAIQAGTLGRIGVAMVFFSSEEFGVMGVPIGWTIINDQKSANAFAQSVLALERQSGRGTSISEGLDLALRTLVTSPLRAPKSVIDVSGDGVNNAGGSMTAARDRVLANGITINGLPIVDDSSSYDLEGYYRSCVAGGPGSFVIPATGFADFARAIRRKLILEISGLTPRERPESGPRLMKAAATPGPTPSLPGRPLLSRGGNAPNSQPYPGGCDFPMGGGFGGPFFR